MPLRSNVQELVDTLDPFFQRRREMPFAWGNVISAYLALPGLRGFWPMSSVGASGEAMDLSAHGFTLTNNNNAQFEGQGPRSYAKVAVTPWYFNRADEAAFDILGTETYIDSGNRGLTIGCWFSLRTLLTVQRTIMAKWSGGAQQSYRLAVRADEKPLFQISGDGANVYQIESPVTITTASGDWRFIAGTYSTTGTDNINIYVSDAGRLTKTTNNVGIPAAIFNSSADFTIGADHGGLNPMALSNVMMCFLCVTALSEGTLNGLYHLSRPFLLRRPVSNF